jgi:lipoprotein-anchoring transpeptidase ErfK/SrfK
MKTMARSMTMISSLLILAAAIGCEPMPPDANRVANTNTVANPGAANANTANANMAASKTSTKASNLTITLPLLDALFAEPTFANDLKAKLQLTDAQVEQLRRIARDATAKLRETSDPDSHQGTTANARKQADEQINTAIGTEKAQQLATFISQRTSGESTATVPTSSSAIPSDTRIVVNAPAFRMDVFDKGQLVKSYKIAIGYPEFPLPTGMRKAETIIFNPTWTPPDEPWVEAPGSRVKVGETVKAGDKLNPLGVLKIPIGQPSLIHGGKPVARLGNFGSHGCVGLTNPQAQEFAKLVAQIDGAAIDDAQIAEYQKNKTETKNVKLAKPLPVELRYDTLVVEDGKLHIYRDVYDHDTNTEDNLRAVLQANGVTLEQLSEQERTQVLTALTEMSRDASGKLDDDSSSKNANSSSKVKPNTSRKVTRVIKGRKEIVVEVAALKGKGYPAPVAMNTGGAPEPTAKKSAGKSKK